MKVLVIIALAIFSNILIILFFQGSSKLERSEDNEKSIHNID